MIYVTHDQIEAMTLADRIVVLRAGHVEQVGAPMELYDRPANLFVAGFIGSPKMNFFAAKVAAAAGSGTTVALSSGQLISAPVDRNRTTRRHRHLGDSSRGPARRPRRHDPGQGLPGRAPRRPDPRCTSRPRAIWR